MNNRGFLLSLIEKIKLKESHFLDQAFIGFDGFTDDILEVVKTRSSPTDYQVMLSIEEFGKTILDAASVSCNIEMILKQKKLGGNAPILANALLNLGKKVNFVGAIGKNEIEPLFLPFAKRCQQAIPITSSGHTDAIEFKDGKILLGRHESILPINYNMILQALPLEDLITLLDNSSLFVSANWTMLPHMNDLWQKLQYEVMPRFTNPLKIKKRHLFIDLADPKKRNDEDLKEALMIIKQFEPTYKVSLGLNASEFKRLVSLFGVDQTMSVENEHYLAHKLREKLEIDTLVIHTKRWALACQESQTVYQNCPFCENPKITTGAGDNFNAGFCLGLMNNFKLEEALYLAIHTAGFYIRNATSPTLYDLINYLTSQTPK